MRCAPSRGAPGAVPPPTPPSGCRLCPFCALGLDLYYCCYYCYYCVARRRKRYFQTGEPPRCPVSVLRGGGCWQRAASAVAFLSPFLSLLYSPPSLFLFSLVPFSTLFPAGVCHRFGAGVKSWLVKGECLPASGVQQKRYCRAQGSGRGKNKLLAKSPGAEPWEEESGPSLHRCHRAARPMRL